DSVYGDKSQTKIAFKIINKYEPIRESKKAGRKYIGGGPNVILTKKMKPGFWVGIDKKFLVKKVSEQSEVGKLDSNTVVYRLYRIRKPDVNRLIPIKDRAFNCVAQQVIEHFDNTKRGHGLTEIRRQKINDWEKKMRIPGTQVQDVAELEKNLKRPIKLLDITYDTIFNSGKYRSGKYEEIGIVVHNGHAFPRNQHFPRDRMVKYYKGDTWEAIKDGRIFRTLKKHTEIIKACKQLVNDTIDWQYQEGIINKEKKSILSESLKVIDLAEQVFGANHARSRLTNEINEWHPISGKVNENIRQVCVKHGHGECTPWFNRFGHPTHYLVRVAVNRELSEDDITRFAQVRSFKFALNIHSVIPIWYRKHFAYRSGEGCGKEKGWAPIVLLQYLLEVGILESVTIGEAIISLTKQTK
ncbi:8111_t:CDS:2, partial [Racocetra persica]